MGLGAAIASFFIPGLGQGFKREVKRGFIIFGIILAAGVIQSITVGISPVLAILLSIPIALFYFANILDAYGVFRIPL